MKEPAPLWKPHPCFFNILLCPFMTHPSLGEEQDFIQHLGKSQRAQIHKSYVSSGLRVRLLVDKCFGDQSDSKKNCSQKKVETICPSASVEARITAVRQEEESNRKMVRRSCGFSLHANCNLNPQWPDDKFMHYWHTMMALMFVDTQIFDYCRYPWKMGLLNNGRLSLAG